MRKKIKSLGQEWADSAVVRDDLTRIADELACAMAPFAGRGEAIAREMRRGRVKELDWVSSNFLARDYVRLAESLLMLREWVRTRRRVAVNLRGAEAKPTLVEHT